MNIRIRPELSEYKSIVDEKSRTGVCEGDCDVHSGDCVSVRVFDHADGFDWGWFSYCETAMHDDKTEGFDFIYE